MLEGKRGRGYTWGGGKRKRGVYPDVFGGAI